MTLLDQEVKKEEPKSKKIILLLLIISIILLISIIAIMFVLSGNREEPLTLSVNGSNITIDNDLLITDENGINYVSIQKISNSIGYDYLTGEYQQYSEDATNSKGYLQNENQIIQFEADSNKIYKTSPESILDYEEYELKNNIVKLNNLLYISLDDVNIGLGVICSRNNNTIAFNTIENLTESYKTSLSTQTNNQFVEISDEYNNEKALLYNMIVIANENKKWGVVDGNFSTIIGNKYTSIEFAESAKVFIVSDDNKYGVISGKPNQKPIIDLNYEEIKIVNNSPTLYQVKLAGKYGIMDEKGKPVINNEYDSIGYISQSTTELSISIIEGYGTSKDNLLVVCKDGKYGLVNLYNGKTIGDCILDKVYGKMEHEEKKYYIQLQGKEFTMEQYIQSITTTTVNVQ